MANDKKSLAAMIIGGGGSSLSDLKKENQKGFEAQASAEGPEEMDEGLKAASQEAIDAIHAKDPIGFAEALKAFMQIADGDDSGSEEMPEGEEE